MNDEDNGEKEGRSEHKVSQIYSLDRSFKLCVFDDFRKQKEENKGRW